jgi:NAD(P)-dependent dehydrogenase (short-subunit alcohol dehydrogenase family)
MPKASSIEERVAIITGAGENSPLKFLKNDNRHLLLIASGMGLAVTKHLLSKGWKVGMSDVNKQQGDNLAAELGEHVLFFPSDVTNYDEQAQLFESVWKKWGRVDYGKFAIRCRLLASSW